MDNRLDMQEAIDKRIFLKTRWISRFHQIQMFLAYEER